MFIYDKCITTVLVLFLKSFNFMCARHMHVNNTTNNYVCNYGIFTLQGSWIGAITQS